MLIDHFPVLGLRLTTPRLELRLPTADQLDALARLAADGIHDPATMPFLSPWTDQSPAEVARSVVQSHWRSLGTLTATDWKLPFAVLRDGVVVGVQQLRARDLAHRGEVSSGSWLGRRHHGQGIGTEMRAAVLELAFTGLGAERAISAAVESNLASRAVSAKLGYQPNGTDRVVVRGAPVIDHRVALSRADWQRHRTIEVTIDGLTPCLPLLRAGSGGSTERP